MHQGAPHKLDSAERYTEEPNNSIHFQSQNSKPSVAILGTRGIPTEYGGFETFGKKLAQYLISKRYQVSAYGIHRYQPKIQAEMPGLKQIWLPSPKHRGLEKTFAAWTSVVHASLSDTDVILMLGVSPALLSFLPKLIGKRIIINLDGVEWKRRKWGTLAKSYLYLCEQHAKKIAHATIVDSQALLPYHVKHNGISPHFIPYGTDIIHRGKRDSTLLNSIGLQPNKYILQVCRLEPENNPDWVIREYLKTNLDIPLVIAGDSPYPSPYVRQLKEACERVRFIGRTSGELHKSLLTNSTLYIHGHEIGGTNPSLLEAMGAGSSIIALDVAFNREVLAQCGKLACKEPGDLAQTLETYWKNTQWQQEQSTLTRIRAQKHYNWTPVFEAYENLILE